MQLDKKMIESLYEKYSDSNLYKTFHNLQIDGMWNPTTIAKPRGSLNQKFDAITLLSHTSNVIRECYENTLVRDYSISKFIELSGSNEKDIIKNIFLICLLHDIGKNYKDWQDACKKDFQSHLLGMKGSALLTAGIRHEMIYLPYIHSLLSEHGNKDADFLTCAIAAHHRKLSLKYSDRIDEATLKAKNINNKHFNTFFNTYKNGFLNFFKTWSDKHSSLCLSDPFSDKKLIDTWYKQAFYRHHLQYADRRASAKEANNPVKDVKKFSYNFPYTHNNIQSKILESDIVKSELVLLRSRTGGGKSDAALLWANEKIKEGVCDRVVIAMPTMFTSNAMSFNLKERVGEVGLHHSTARMIENKLDNEWAKSLDTTATVCTIDHLLIALSLQREEHHSILLNLTNSCLIIDEADFYDDFVQASIKKLLIFLKHFNVPVMIMSATLPDSYITFCEESGYDIKLVEDKSEHTLVKSKINNIINDNNDFIINKRSKLNDVLEKALEVGTCIIYANTVKRAKRYYDWFSANNKPILYHSKFTSVDKLDKERDIINNLGKKAWDNGNANGVIIMTQVGEMSLNISVDMIISDVAPFDRLVQRLGRGKRFDDGMCDVYIINPISKGYLYPAPYGHYDVTKHYWVANDAMKSTVDILKKNKVNGKTDYSIKDFIDTVNQIYPSFKLSNKAISNTEILETCFKSQWLYQNMNSADENGNTGGWQVRNITRNEIELFIDKPNATFDTWFEYEINKRENTIKLDMNYIEKMMGVGVVHELDIIVGNEEKSIYYLDDSSLYNKHDGLDYYIY
jgi:CRISPR-associated endonuclease/helicase Cas3